MSATISTQPAEVVDPFHLEGLGIGGLQAEFGVVFSRALASRLYPKHLVEQLGIRHVRGILLSGPAGTGKTLIARRIGDILNAAVAIVNVPELVSRSDGDASLQQIFGPAREQGKEMGDQAPLHLIIFDELDALQVAGTPALLEKLLETLDDATLSNVLVVGLTTHKDHVAPALLRPGRFEFQLEIGLPSKEARVKIFRIHTRELREKNFLSPEVDLNALASATENFTGAEIDAVVRAASLLAFQRAAESPQVTLSDFQTAVEEVKPKKGN